MIQINGKDVSQIRVGNKIVTAVYIGVSGLTHLLGKMMKAGKTNKFSNYDLQKIINYG